MPKVTIIPQAASHNLTHIEVNDVIRDIKSCRYQIKIDELRAEKDKARHRKLKESLPAIMWAGEFLKRGDKNLSIHSGLCILDIDHIGTSEAVETEKEKLKSVPYIFAMFISPSGNGLKVVVKIPPCNQNDHRRYYVALMNKYPQSDPTSINPERLCFFSCDKNIYINPDATEFTEMGTQEEVDAIVERGKKTNGEVKIKVAPVNDYVMAERALKMIRDAEDGKKHIMLLKASKLMGGFIAGGYIQQSEGTRLLQTEISNKPNVTDLTAAYKTIQNGINYGMRLPIEKIEQQLKIESNSEGIQYMDLVWAEMKHNFNFGKKRGTTTYFPKLDIRFTWKERELSLFIGRGGAGKTEFILQLMLMKSVFEDWKWGIFSPENEPPEDFYDALIHAYIGKTTDPYFKELQMTMDEYERGYDFIKKHFFYVYPDDDKHTIAEIEGNFLHLIETEGIKGVMYDPYNQITTEDFQREDLFLKVFLKERKAFAKKNNLCSVMTAHPKVMFREKGTNEYPIVNLFDIAGGAMWSNKVDNIISIHRPNYHKDPSDTKVEIHVLRIKKHKLVGIPGVVTFDYLRKSNRFYEENYNPLEPEKQQPETINYDEPQYETHTDSPF